MKSAPGYLWGGMNFYLIGLDKTMDVTNKSECFKKAVVSIGRDIDQIQTKMGDDQRTRSFNG